MQHLLNTVRLQAMMAASGKSVVRMGLVQSYDPSTYAVRVTIQPQDVLTGWLPLATTWVGNGWGFYAPPSIGDMVDVHYQEDDPNVGFVNLRFFNDVERPLAVPSGEFWIVHATGSAHKFHNDGSVDAIAHTNLNVTVGGAATVHVTGAATVTTGGDANITVGGVTNLTSTGDVTVRAPHFKVNP